MSLTLIFRLCSYLLFILLMSVEPSSMALGSDASDEESLAAKVRSLLRNIYDRNYDAIMDQIPNEGLTESDRRISKEQIRKELMDPASFLRRELYKPLTVDHIAECVSKLGGKMLVSPYAFYSVHGEKYKVASAPLEGSDRTYFGVKITPLDAGLNPKGCELELWRLEYRKINQKFYLASYFFF